MSDVKIWLDVGKSGGGLGQFMDVGAVARHEFDFQAVLATQPMVVMVVKMVRQTTLDALKVALCKEKVNSFRAR